MRRLPLGATAELQSFAAGLAWPDGPSFQEVYMKPRFENDGNDLSFTRKLHSQAESIWRCPRSLCSRCANAERGRTGSPCPPLTRSHHQ